MKTPNITKITNQNHVGNANGKDYERNLIPLSGQQRAYGARKEVRETDVVVVIIILERGNVRQAGRDGTDALMWVDEQMENASVFLRMRDKVHV